MAIKPKIVTLTNNSVDILNAIRNSASVNYRDYVPVAEANADSIREIGAVIMAYPALQNEFLSALVNRIGRVVITSKMYDNPLAMFKKGVLEMGETIEEIFVNIAKPFQYDMETAENEVFKREIPDVRVAFHTLNYKKFYKVTVTENELRLAFLSWNGVTDLIAKIVDSMYTGANYDEFQTTKYLLARNLLNGLVFAKGYNETDGIRATVTAIKAMSNKLTFMSNKYNLTGVQTHTPKDNQYILINADFEAEMGVDVLATAFNMDKAEFMGRRILVDGFGELDIERLNTLFDGDDTYVEIGQDELDALNAIPVVIVDRDYFMIYDILYQFTENYNGQGTYWNYFYHTWKSFSTSPFANAVAFIPTTSDDEIAVTDITITPQNVTVKAGQNMVFTADVTTSGFAPKSVNWSLDTSSYSGADKVSISPSGTLTVGTSAPAGSFIVIAKSTYSNVQKQTTVTVEV